MKYPEDSIQSQYAASRAIRALVDGMNLRIDPAADIDLFYEKFFNIYTAEGAGLDNWGVILGAGRLLAVPGGDFFGFSGSGLSPFDNAPFYYHGVTDNYYLTDEAYRRLLLFKALANISAADAATLNKLLAKVFDGRAAYVLEAAPMEIRFNFEFYLTPHERALMRLEYIPPHPGGVGYYWLEADPAQTFGFAGSGLQPFDQGTFNRGPYWPG